MNDITLCNAMVSRVASRDWLTSIGAHAILAAGVFGMASTVVLPEIQRLDISLRSIEPMPPMAHPAIERVPQEPRPVVQAPRRQTPQPRTDSPVTQSAEAAPPVPTASPLPAPPARPVEQAAAPVSEQTRSAARAAAPDPHAYQQWRARLEQALQQHKRYPVQARRMGQSGTVLVQLKLAADGELLLCAVAESSGFRSLDQAAEHLVRAVAQSMQAHHAPGQVAELRIPIVYELTES